MKNDTKTKDDPTTTQNDAPKKLKIKTSVRMPASEPMKPCTMVIK